MSETTQFVSRISVKDLISAFETKSETVRVEFSRPRARSFGNVLNKNVVVRLNEYLTLEDIEKGLTKLEIDLNFYEVYNKAKHVAFQEQFFNILTSIANIENNDENAPTRKKRLISRTQTLVSFLNQKLPTNINQVIEPKPTNEYKYTTYASHVKASTKTETDGSKAVETRQNADPKVQPTLYVESSSTIDVTDSGEEYIVSVKKLKENFQHKTETDGTAKEKVVNVNQKVTVTKSIETTERPKQQVKQTKEHTEAVVKNTKIEQEGKAVSVTKLRSLFEERSSSKGLEVITIDKPQLTKTNWGGSVQNVNSIPYTERNLGSIRLQRSVSGNYMNYSGLLKRVDINRSSSVLELNPDNKRIVVENTSDEESGDESDNPLENERGSITIQEISSIPLDNKNSVDLNVRKGHVLHITRDFENGQIQKSFSTDQEESDDEATDNLLNGRVTFTSDSHSLEVEKENTSNLQGYEEEEVFYSKASLEKVDKDKTNKPAKESTFHGVEEIEVNSGTADSKNILQEENVATLEAVDVSTSDNSEEVKSYKTTENESSFKGYDEEEVNQGTASSENVQVEENVAKLEAEANDVSQSISITEVETNNLHDDELPDNRSESDEFQPTQETDDQFVRNSEDNHSIFNSLHDLDDERERSFIDEVIEKIDIEETLANADLVVNPEDLKNADDEFEKLLENSQSGK